jgi:hypothetical protein
MCLFGLMAAAIIGSVIFLLNKLKSRNTEKTPPEFLMGAIRVTDRQGRDMLIIRKDDGSFEMHEEQKIRKQSAS